MLESHLLDNSIDASRSGYGDQEESTCDVVGCEADAGVGGVGHAQVLAISGVVKSSIAAPNSLYEVIFPSSIISLSGYSLWHEASEKSKLKRTAVLAAR